MPGLLADFGDDLRVEPDLPSLGALSGSKKILHRICLKYFFENISFARRKYERERPLLPFRRLDPYPAPCDLVREIHGIPCLGGLVRDDADRPFIIDGALCRRSRRFVCQDNFPLDVDAAQAVVIGVPDPDEIGGNVGAVAAVREIDGSFGDVGELHFDRLDHPELRRFRGVVRPSEILLNKMNVLEPRLLRGSHDVIGSFKKTFHA